MQEYIKNLSSGTTTVIILNDEMKDIEIIKSLENSGLSLK